MLALLANLALYVVPFLIVITLIVSIHELGHFLVARWLGVAVDRFSIGFGRALLSFRDRWGVEWRLAWLPFGGYVRFAGDENLTSIPDLEDLTDLRREIVAREGPSAEKKYFYFKPVWQRTLVVMAGPAANFLLSIALFSLLFATLGEAVTQGPISSIVPDSAAARAGFKTGDLIVAADGHALRGFEDLRQYVVYRDGVTIDFTINRGGQLIHLYAAPTAHRAKSLFGGQETSGLLGVQQPLKPPAIVHYDPIAAVGMGASRTWEAVSTTGYYVARIVTGRAAADQLHGFIGIVKVSGGVAEQAVHDAPKNPGLQMFGLVVNMVSLSALLSVTVGLVNLLPIPILDGGHLVFYAYEAVVRRPLSGSIQAASYRVGLALLVCMMLFANWNDLQRLQVFRFFGALFS
jgi:regulator of sigma E protease